MLVPKKYRFIHPVIIVCSHGMQPLTTIPLWPPPSVSFRMPKSTPTCIPASSTPHPCTPKPLFSTVSLLRSLWFRWTGPARKKERKKEKKWPVWVGQGVPASRKCFSVPPSLWGVAAGEGWSLGGLPTREVCGHWGFWDSPHTSLRETSAETVKAGLVADLHTQFLPEWLIDRYKANLRPRETAKSW